MTNQQRYDRYKNAVKAVPMDEIPFEGIANQYNKFPAPNPAYIIHVEELMMVDPIIGFASPDFNGWDTVGPGSMCTTGRFRLIPVARVEPPLKKISIIDALVGTGNAVSRSEARRAVSLGGVCVNGQEVKDIGALVGDGDTIRRVGRASETITVHYAQEWRKTP